MKKNVRIRFRNKMKFTAFITCFLLVCLLSCIFIPLTGVKGNTMITYREYTIKAGDTLWNIASNINVCSMDIREIIFDIKVLNDLDDNAVIVAGEQILLPIYSD